MSVLRHAHRFERTILPDGRSQWSRRNGHPEKVLLIAGDGMVQTINASLCETLVEVQSSESLPQALRLLRDDTFELIIVDAGLADFPLDLFLFSLSKLAPELTDRMIFLVGPKMDPRWGHLINQGDALIVWRGAETHELLAAVERVLSIAPSKGSGPDLQK